MRYGHLYAGCLGSVAGTGLKELVSRSIFLCQNADYQMKAYLLGAPTPLRPGEIKHAGSINVMPSVVARTWEYWSVRLHAAGFWPPQEGARRAGGKACAAGAAPGEKKKRRDADFGGAIVRASRRDGFRDGCHETASRLRGTPARK